MKKHFLNIENINEHILENTKQFISDGEKMFHNQIDELIFCIDNNGQNESIILISGPSCAGKTTFSNILKQRLESKGTRVVTIGMDNFFIDRVKRKRLPNGEEDMETLNIFDLDLMDQCFTKLFKEKKAMFPEYDFPNFVNIPNKIPIEINDKTVIIFEGIHVLNPTVIAHLGSAKIYKIFISNYNSFISNDIELKTRELRFIRRIVRDTIRRNISPRETLALWPNITKNEDENIFPFKHNADFEINSTHPFELAFYRKKIAEYVEQDPALLVDLPFLSKVFESVELDPKLLPNDSLMWEFIDKPLKKSK